MPSNFDIQPTQREKSAAISIDLSDYVNAFKAYFSSPTQENKAIYSSMRKSITDEIKEVEGCMLWELLIDKALQNESPELQEKVKQSPASKYLLESFVELLKNTLDAIILMNDEKNSSLLAKMDIDISLDQENISIRLMDNGPGFSEEFIKQIATEATRKEYLLGRGSPKKMRNLQESLPELFGGAGKGLRILIAKIDEDADLVDAGKLRPKYIKPVFSKVNFENDPESHGAVISVKSSIEPLQAIKQKKVYTEEISLSNESLMILPPNRFKAMKKKFEELVTQEEPNENAPNDLNKGNAVS